MDDETKAEIGKIVSEGIRAEVSAAAQDLKDHIDSRFYPLNKRLYDLETDMAAVKQKLGIRDSQNGRGH
jgi:hypothetical protein